MKARGPIKVLIVDDSLLVRTILTKVLDNESDIEVVGGAPDPFFARELIIRHRPDVIVLDIIMPRMDGITFLKKLKVHYPVPVIICSGVAPANSARALEALDAGAIDVVAKPSCGGPLALQQLGEDLAEKIRAAHIALPAARAPSPRLATPPRRFSDAGLDPNHTLVVIGASTGGTEAINDLLSNVPDDFPPVAMVQHMPAGFTRSFADRLDRFSRLQVTEAVEGDNLESGRAFLAQGGTQMYVTPVCQRWRIRYGDHKLVNRHCPSVDVLFNSAARHAPSRAVGVLLTGMGADGAAGLLAMRQAGAITIAQNRESCVVYGMPKAAVDNGAAQHTALPAAIPGLILRELRKRKTVRPAAYS